MVSVRRLGRYPVHFHLNGDMSGSYIRDSSIANAFNRAVNIHNTHNVRVLNNVAYNVYGGAMFTEDSIETGKTGRVQDFQRGTMVLASRYTIRSVSSISQILAHNKKADYTLAHS